MKQFTKVTLSILVLAYLLSVLPSNGFANLSAEIEKQSAGITPLYIGTYQIRASLKIMGGIAYCGSSLEVYSGYQGYLTMYLQRKSSNGSWINVKSWSGSASESTRVTLSEAYTNLVVGTTYRVHAVGNEYQDGSFVERVSVTSPERIR